MSDDQNSNPQKTKDRIPFETLDDSAEVSGWNLPSMHSAGQVVRSKERDNNATRNQKVSIEPVKNKKKPKPLTAEELQKITEDARKEGFQQGLHEGTEKGIREGTKAGEKAGQQRAYMEAKKEIEALQHELRQLTTRLFDPMQQQDQLLENILVDLALNLAQRVIDAEVSVNPKLILAIVQRVLNSLPKGADNIRVSMNDKDASLVEALVPEAQRDWSIQRDSSLSSGGCVVETASSLSDFSVEERLAIYLEKINLLQTSATELEDVPDYQSEESTKEKTTLETGAANE